MKASRLSTSSTGCGLFWVCGKRPRGSFLPRPYRFVRSKVEVLLTPRAVQIFSKSERIAAHLRASGNRRHTTVPEHMPSSDRRYADWTLSAFTIPHPRGLNCIRLLIFTICLRLGSRTARRRPP